MVELAFATGWRLDELEQLDDVTLATLVDVHLERGQRQHG
jgi:hypothetical protein